MKTRSELFTDAFIAACALLMFPGRANAIPGTRLPSGFPKGKGEKDATEKMPWKADFVGAPPWFSGGWSAQVTAEEVPYLRSLAMM